MVFLFSACGANNDAKSTDTQAVQTTAGTQAATTTAKNTEPIKMKLLIMSADESRKAIADKFEAGIPKDMPEYSVEIERAGGGEDYNNKLKTYNAVGELPDIFWVDNIPNTVPLINSGMLLDLTSSVTSDGFLDKYSPKPQAWNDGKYYVLNVGSDEYFVPRIFYRKSIFEQNKVAVPKTLDEFMAACKVFKDKGLVPWATYAKDGWCFTTYLFQNLVMSEDPQVMKDLMANKTDFSNKVCINAINRIQQMVNSGVFQQGVLTGEYGAVSDLFTQKKAAMYTMFTWIIPTLATDDDVDFFAFPQINTSIDRDKLIQIWGGPLNGYACSSKTKDPAATVKMLEYMIQTEGLYWNADQKTPTTYNSGVKLENLPALMQKHVDNYASAEKMVTFSNYVFSAKMNTEFNTLGQKVLSGKYSGEDFAKDINPVWANSLKELTQ
jgi:ABC-type sugar transport system, periplasmic component